MVRCAGTIPGSQAVQCDERVVHFPRGHALQRRVRQNAAVAKRRGQAPQPGGAPHALCGSGRGMSLYTCRCHSDLSAVRFVYRYVN